jgi:hypothetical protein
MACGWQDYCGVTNSTYEHKLLFAQIVLYFEAPILESLSK